MDDIKRFLPENFYVNLPKKALNRATMVAINNLASYYSSMIEDAIDQQFVSSAGGKYLLYLGEQNGFSLPPKSGLDITALKTLIPIVSFSPKQIASTFQKLVGAFYTDLKTKPNIIASVPGPYSLTSGDSLIFESETGRYEITVLSKMVSDITNIDPAEIASIINLSQTFVKADTYVDITTSLRYLRIMSATFGLGAFLRVIGGAVQNVLQFPVLTGSYFVGGTKFIAAKDAPYSDNITLTWDGVGLSPNLFKVAKGDFVTIRGMSNYLRSPNLMLNGTYEVLSTGFDYIKFKGNVSYPPNSFDILAYSSAGSNVISVSYPDHGFNTGMRVNVSSSVSLGGLIPGELSVVDTPIVVVSADSFTYLVASPAITSDQVSLNSVVPSSYFYSKSHAEFSLSSGSNVVTVIWNSHGLQNGDLISGVCHLSSGGLTPLQLSFVDLPVVVASIDSISVTLPDISLFDDVGEYLAIGISIVAGYSNTIMTTSQKKIRIYDQTEYAYVAEPVAEATKVLVPAVPPLTRRFLVGSAHLHGQKFPVVDFTRTSITLDLKSLDGKLAFPNSFVLTNPYIRPNFSLDNQYLSSSSTSALGTQEVFSVSASAPNGILPFTLSQPIGLNSIYAVPGSDEFEISFPFVHGLRSGWELTLSVSSGSGNIVPSFLNGNHIVLSSPSSTLVRIRSNNGSGQVVPYQGVPFTGFDVVQGISARADGADFYLQFATPLDVVNSGLIAGSVFKVSLFAGTNVFPSYANIIRQYNYTVTSVETDRVYFNVGIGVGMVGIVISATSGARSDNFGGNCSYFFDKTSLYNVKFVMNDLFAFPMNSQVSANTGYVGSFLYDPKGVYFPYSLSGTKASLSSIVLRGSSPTAIFVDSVQDWPTSGYIYMSYGSSNQEGPIPYRALILAPGNSQILIDPSYIFKFTHNIGQLAFRLNSLSPLAPWTTEVEYPVYLTGTAAARETLRAILKEMMACGIVLDWNVLLPRLRYDDVSIPPYEEPAYPSNPGAIIGLLPTRPL